MEQRTLNKRVFSLLVVENYNGHTEYSSKYSAFLVRFAIISKFCAGEILHFDVFYFSLFNIRQILIFNIVVSEIYWTMYCANMFIILLMV